MQGAGLGGTEDETANGLSLRVTGDSHWFLNQEVEGDFALTGKLVDFPTRTWRDPAYGHVQGRSWMGLMFTIKPRSEPCFYNAYGFYRLAQEGWRGTPCHVIWAVAAERTTNIRTTAGIGFDWSAGGCFSLPPGRGMARHGNWCASA